ARTYPSIGRLVNGEGLWGRRRPTPTSALRGLGAREVVFRIEERVEAAKDLDVGDLDAFARDPHVLPIAESLHGPLHGLDVEAHTGRQLHGRNRHLGGPGGAPGPLQEAAGNPRLPP